MPAGLITVVAPDGLGKRAGLHPGDKLLSVNGRQPQDIIDVRFLGGDDHLTLEVERGETVLTSKIERRFAEPLGLEFAHPTFDPIRQCHNHCPFCFVAQMPPGLRRSLFIRDDDYRYSFLFGNYITLTNLEESDWKRIGEQNLSPLYVSVHTTEPALRRRLLRNPAAPQIMVQLRRLAGIGIEMHTQIVVIPGENDGSHLDRSIQDLAGLHPKVRSVSVVPLGLTRFHRGGCRIHTDAEVRRVFERVTRTQEQLHEHVGQSFVHLSDEWYLRLGERVPPVETYGGQDLSENGVGLVRRFLDSLDHHSRDTDLRAQLPSRDAVSLTLVTGELFEPVLREAAARLAESSSLQVEVVPVVNCFLGETVTVAGLLTGQDVVEQLLPRQLGGYVVLPSAMFGGPDGQSLDGMWPHQVAEALGRPLLVRDRL